MRLESSFYRETKLKDSDSSLLVLCYEHEENEDEDELPSTGTIVLASYCKPLELLLVLE